MSNYLALRVNRVSIVYAAGDSYHLQAPDLSHHEKGKTGKFLFCP